MSIVTVIEQLFLIIYAIIALYLWAARRRITPSIGSKRTREHTEPESTPKRARQWPIESTKRTRNWEIMAQMKRQRVCV
jgi:hypothetical protein